MHKYLRLHKRDSGKGLGCIQSKRLSRLLVAIFVFKPAMRFRHVGNPRQGRFATARADEIQVGDSAAGPSESFPDFLFCRILEACLGDRYALVVINDVKDATALREFLVKCSVFFHATGKEVEGEDATGKEVGEKEVE